MMMEIKQKAIEPHLEILRTGGYRITPIVTAVLTLLSASHQVKTTNELRTEISSHLGYDVGNPTIYRICERLALSGVLYQMHKNDGVMRYFLCNEPHKEKHHHFICTRCMHVQEVECSIRGLLAQVVKKTLHATVENHFIQIEGICRDCKA